MSLSDLVIPGQTIGIVGGGQLGRMMSLAAKSMGFKVGILDPVDNCPAGQVADWQIQANYNDEVALVKMAERCDVITYEFENVDVNTLQIIEKIVPVPQGSELLAITQDRILEKAFLESINVNIAPYATIVVVSNIEESIDAIGFPCVLKTTRGGYDGKGQHVMFSMSDIQGCLPLLKQGTCVLEAWIPFEKEISVMVAANGLDEVSVFPVVENIHRRNILHQTIAPAKISKDVAEEAQRVARQIAKQLNLRGVLGIEMFVTDNGFIYVNELAPRPHNSGHYSIEACNFSQFEAHLRGVCNWPLAPVSLLSPAIMVNILGEHLIESMAEIPSQPDWHFHYYGKAESKAQRKMGHITVLTDDIEETLQQMDETKIWN